MNYTIKRRLWVQNLYWCSVAIPRYGNQEVWGSSSISFNEAEKKVRELVWNMDNAMDFDELY